jgi:Xaa-Pro aminopeptidase
MNYKIKCLREKMKLLEIDGMIISNPINIEYITGVYAEGTLIINDKDNIFITDARYIEDVNSTITISDEINVRDQANISENEYISFFANCPRVGIEENYISYSKYQNLVRIYRLKEAVETNNLIEKMRTIKDDNEIAKIRRACEITDNCFTHLLEYIKVGMTERQIAFEIEKYFIENGANGLAFDTIVASGENSSKPHAVPTNRKIQSGDNITIDFGAKYKGYCSDMTRTIFVGSVSDEVRNLYNFILEGQLRATNKIKDGVDGKSVARGVQIEYNARNFELIHALGHGVGLEVHELPYLSYRSSQILKENMVVTNEPGIYIPEKIGIRIEDTILVNKLESEVLTKSSKELIVI